MENKPETGVVPAIREPLPEIGRHVAGDMRHERVAVRSHQGVQRLDHLLPGLVTSEDDFRKSDTDRAMRVGKCLRGLGERQGAEFFKSGFRRGAATGEFLQQRAQRAGIHAVNNSGAFFAPARSVSFKLPCRSPSRSSVT